MFIEIILRNKNGKENYTNFIKGILIVFKNIKQSFQYKITCFTFINPYFQVIAKRQQLDQDLNINNQ